MPVLVIEIDFGRRDRVIDRTGGDRQALFLPEAESTGDASDVLETHLSKREGRKKTAVAPVAVETDGQRWIVGEVGDGFLEGAARYQASAGSDPVGEFIGFSKIDHQRTGLLKLDAFGRGHFRNQLAGRTAEVCVRGSDRRFRHSRMVLDRGA